MKNIALSGCFGLLLRPRAPSGLRAGDVFQADAIDRAHRHAQGFVDDGQRTRAFAAVGWVQGQYRQAGDGGKALHAFCTARRALVDGGCA